MWKRFKNWCKGPALVYIDPDKVNTIKDLKYILRIEKYNAIKDSPTAERFKQYLKDKETK